MGLLHWLFGDAHQSAAEEAVAKLKQRLFPRGQVDIDALAYEIVMAVPGKLTRAHGRRIGPALAAIHRLSDDRSDERLLVSLRPMTRNLTEAERLRVVHAVVGEWPTLTPESDGSSAERPIKILAKSSLQGTGMEQRVLERLLGRRGSDWTLGMSLHAEHGSQYIERFQVKLADGRHRTIYFDITSFVGR